MGRSEPFMTLYRGALIISSNPEGFNHMEKSKLILSGMRALWGIITPNVRKVSIHEQNNVILLIFYYDKEPSDDEMELSEEAATEVIADFPDPFSIECERNVISFPKKIDVMGNLIFSRHEPISI